MPSIAAPLTDLLRQARALQASDLHLRADHTPWVRRHGQLLPLHGEDGARPIGATALRDGLRSLVPPGLLAAFEAGEEVDFAESLPELGRFRVNAFAHQNGWGAVLRCLPEAPPSLDSLQVPPALLTLLDGPGLLLVTGPTGSGKSTTLAAIVQHLNHHTSQHLLTLEDPIEYLHTSARCLITQREIGPHSASFAQGLRAALREDPDVLLIGELRDLDTIRLGLTAAETGHLVLASLHTRHAAASVARIVDVFDAAEKILVRSQLAEALRGVLSQSLHPTPQGTGQSAVFELLVATPAVQHLIREGKTGQLTSQMQTGAAHGMVTMAQALQAAEAQGRVASTR